MESKNKKEMHFVIVFTIIVIAVVIIATFVGVINTYILMQKVNKIKEGPYETSNIIYKISGEIAQAKGLTSSFRKAHTDGKIKGAKTQYDVIDQVIRNDLQTLSTGIYKDNETVKKYIEKVDACNKEVGKLINYLLENIDIIPEILDLSNEESKKIYDMVCDLEDNFMGRDIAEGRPGTPERLEIVEPYFNEEQQVILAFLTTDVNNIASDSFYTMLFVTIVSILLSIIVSVVSIYMYVLVKKRVSDKIIYYREFLFDIIAKNIDDVIIVTKLRSRVPEFVSPNVERVFGKTVDEVMNNRVSKLLFDNPQLIEVDKAISEGAFCEKIAIELCSSESYGVQPKWYSFVAYPVFVQSKVERIVAVVRDVTKDKEMKTTLTDALNNAENANNFKSEFLSRVSHEIRTPLNAIIGMSTIAKDIGADKSKIKDCLEKISISSKHLKSLIDDVLDMTKINSSKMVIANESLSLTELINDTSSIIFPQTVQKKIRYKVSSNFRNENFYGDPVRLRQVLLNLLSNSVKYTNERGNIELRVTEKDTSTKGYAKIEFKVIDDGIGMSEEFKKRLFNAFEQEKGDRGGTGLGMAITQNLVQMMNGTIDVESEKDKGTTITVQLLLQHTTESFQPKMIGLEDFSVLIMDKEDFSRDELKNIMEKMGANVYTYSNMSEIDKFIKSEDISTKNIKVIVGNCCCFDENDKEKVEKIQSYIKSGVKVIVTNEDEESCKKCAKKMKIDYLRQPFVEEEVYSILLSATRENKSISKNINSKNALVGQNILVVDDNEINREIAAAFLQRAGATTLGVESGEKAIEVFENSQDDCFSAIILDIQMPGMNGYEVAKIIRQSSKKVAKTIPIIAMTANVFNEDIVKAEKAGMNDHIAKPVDSAIMIEVLLKAFQKG